MKPKLQNRQKANCHISFRPRWHWFTKLDPEFSLQSLCLTTNLPVGISQKIHLEQVGPLENIAHLAIKGTPRVECLYDL